MPVLVKLTPNIGDILEPGARGGAGRARTALSLINTIKSIIGVDLDTLVPLPARRRALDATAATAARR